MWLGLNRLPLNFGKTVYMSFGNYCDSVPNQLDISINNRKLNKVEHNKYLGVVFGYNMKWDKHIEYIRKKSKYSKYTCLFSQCLSHMVT